jgi:lipopolysaccharide/colanic/teichoic acid biosynthesis glycosyltransferase
MSLRLPSTSRVEPAGGLEVAILGTPARPAAPSQRLAARVTRRVAELVLATVLLVLMAPVMALIALAIRIDSPGPVLFRQRRVGRGMHEFTVLKFRSMRAAADSAPHREYVRELIARGADSETAEGGLYKLAVDDRVTTIGRWLRKTSLDELPQLWNVVRGQMSMVGPRPVIPYEVEQYPEWYLARFAVRPGITGLWQVNGRNQRTYEEMVEFDIQYAERQSLRLDVLILAKTLWVVMSGRGVA